MEKARKSWLPFFNKMLSLLLILLGFNACDDNDKDIDGGIKLMYGMPPAEYSIKAKVTDEQNVPIEGIQVDMKIAQSGYIVETGLTDSNGEYNALVYGNKMNVVFTDIDGDKNNGTFEKDSVLVEMSKGEVNYLATIKLKPKK